MPVIEEKKTQPVHNVAMENRERITLTGIEEVESFDESQIMLYTQMGMLTIRGEDLHINKLNVDTGDVVIDGLITSCVYSDAHNGHDGGFWKRIFR